jgi:hypothetical protein
MVNELRPFFKYCFLIAAKVGIEIAKVIYSDKITDKSGTFATWYQTYKY